MLKYLAKISMDIFPSVLATIIGAYIVNHYINARPAADTPAAVSAPADAGKKPAELANLPGPGVKAKGVSEKSVSDKAAVEAKPAEAKDDTTSHGRASPHEKAVAKSTPAAPAAAPVVEANSSPVAPGASPDANDLARAAIERLRKSPEGKAAEKAAEAKASETKPAEAKAEVKPAEVKPSEVKTPEKVSEPAVQEASRTPEAPRIVTAVPTTVRPLPPPINVSTPSPDAYGAASQANPPYTASVGNGSVGNDDPNRLTPPADIPVPVIAPPLDLRADAGAPMPRPKTNVADEMLSGMKSMFHAVLPKGATPD
ncbi:hypothetical protein [uncultured Bradyrhizobium sp.]|jgi:hypothetical protein|uniref:hypothetical protein n=1 Tax=uncultured Bradyrhizobium sp. TaxID=199684 RepID=UPI002602C3A9|nr:hypothetical protein [uncultured Bradyrhizobium sp.]